MHYVSNCQVRVGRVALVLTRTFETSNSAELLISRFCSDDAKSGIFRNSQNFEVHNHKRYPLKEYLQNTKELEVNSWVRCKTAILDSSQKPVILVEQDINTPDEKIYECEFSSDDIGEYFSHAALEAESILHLYFPSES